MRNSNDSVLGKIVLAGASVLGAENAAADVVVGTHAEEGSRNTVVEGQPCEIPFKIDTTSPDVSEYKILSVTWHSRIPEDFDFSEASHPFRYNDFFGPWNPLSMEYNNIDSSLDANRELTDNVRDPLGMQGPMGTSGVLSRMYVTANMGSASKTVKVETNNVEVFGMDSNGNVYSLPVEIVDSDIHIVPKIAEDYNSDGYVDMDDMANFTDCWDHPGSGLRLGCEPLDFNTNGVIDLHDAAKMQRAYTGEKYIGQE